MSETKHMPGPWEAVEDRNSNSIDIETPGISGVVVASIMVDHDLVEEDWANARLIAASPLLLDLLLVISDGGSPLTFREALCAWAVRYGIELPECSNSDELKRSAVAAAIRKGEAQ